MVCCSHITVGCRIMQIDASSPTSMYPYLVLRTVSQRWRLTNLPLGIAYGKSQIKATIRGLSVRALHYYFQGSKIQMTGPLD